METLIHKLAMTLEIKDCETVEDMQVEWRKPIPQIRTLYVLRSPALKRKLKLWITHHPDRTCSIYDVMCMVQSDAMPGHNEYTFDEYCSDYGLNNDSIKEFERYQATIKAYWEARDYFRDWFEDLMNAEE